MTIFSRVDRVPSSATANSVIPNAADYQKADETLDTLFEGNLKFVQSRSGYRVSMDSVLLACFATIRKKENIVELGCGNGVIPADCCFNGPVGSSMCVWLMPDMPPFFIPLMFMSFSSGVLLSLLPFICMSFISGI